jgi:nitroreductase
MEFLDCIDRDRATRAFTDDPVSEADIRAVLDVARRSGSGKNTQPWSFVVVRDRDRLDDLAALGEYTTPLRRAPVGIVVVVDNHGNQRPLESAIFDCGRAFQNMKLAATDRGLGSVPQSVDRERAGELLDVPDTGSVILALALGHPADADDTIEGRDKEEVLAGMGRTALDELVHWETY